MAKYSNDGTFFLLPNWLHATHILQNNTSVLLFGCRTYPTKETLIGGDKPRIGLYNIEKNPYPTINE